MAAAAVVALFMLALVASGRATSTAPMCMLPNVHVVKTQGYGVVARSGDKIRGNPLPLGANTNILGNPVFVEKPAIPAGVPRWRCYSNPRETNINRCKIPVGAAAYVTSSDKPIAVSSSPDGLSFHPAGNKGFLLAHFEAHQPATVYLVNIDADDDGLLSAKNWAPLNWSTEGGLWTPCAASVAPDGSHIGGEEYEPDAYQFEVATSLETLGDFFGTRSLIAQMAYYGWYPGDYDLAFLKRLLNPYNYGFNFKIDVSGGAPQYQVEQEEVQTNGGFTVQNVVTSTSTLEVRNKKLYLVGRASHELAFVMPDRKTLYTTDDGTNVGFYKFVADSADNFDSGTIYAGKFTQLAYDNGGVFDITWVRLASSTTAVVKRLIDGNIRFSQIFEYRAPVNKTCPTGFKSINAGHGDGNQQCLKLKSGMQVAAAFLETRRYAAYMGATTEFSKWEGFTYDPVTRHAYTAITEIRYGMEDFGKKGQFSDKYDGGGYNHIRLPYNACGCVYRLSPETSMSYNLVRMKAEICGHTVEPAVPPAAVDEATEGVHATDFCASNGLANPDNVAVIVGGRKLLIAEDTAGHHNNMLWMYDLTTGTLRRIGNAPLVAEWSGLTAPWEFRGNYYFPATIQHPYGEPAGVGIPAEDISEAETSPYYSGDQGYIGYYGPFPVANVDASRDGLQFTPIPYPVTEEGMNSVTSSGLLLETSYCV